VSEHNAQIAWSRDGRGFGYEQYVREHTARMGGAEPIQLSAAAAFRGDPALANPEDLLVAALSSCHMLTFLAICARKNIIVDRYEDDATGWLERPPSAPMQVTRVTLRPRIVFAGGAPDAATLASLHEQAHHGCFIASSVKTVVTVEAQPQSGTPHASS
jgi:organic hydroperoxide reductase OsmC/OhrA